MNDDYQYLFDETEPQITYLRRRPYFRDRYNPLDWVDDQKCLELYRFDRASILDITGKVASCIRRSTSVRSIPPVLQVILTLKYFAQGITFRTLSEYIGISKSSISRIILNVSRAICAKFENSIQFAVDDGELIERKLRFKEIAGFPNVIGAIDGTLIPIQRPAVNEHIYVCRKGFHAINCMLTKCYIV